ncbi:MAG: hypothetical protein P8Y60_18450 [Calditrichota bacterium]
MDKYGFSEIEAMKKIAQALAHLEPEEVHRVLRWVNDKFGLAPYSTSVNQHTGKTIDERQELITESPDESLSLGEFYALVSPGTDAEKALTIGYWLQVHLGQKEFDSLTVNAHLKNLGHQVSNITRAFSQLQEKKPHLAIQTKKMGHTQQAYERRPVNCSLTSHSF